MAQRTHKLLINAAKFPFSYFKAARSAIENQDIGPRLPGFFAGSQENFDFGQPQLLYCENVMPVDRGLVSPYMLTGNATPVGPTVTTFKKVWLLPTVFSSWRTVSPAVGGITYRYNSGIGRFVDSGSPATIDHTATMAEVNGRYFAKSPSGPLLEWNDSLQQFFAPVVVYPAGMTAADFIGVGSSSNYLLLFTLQGVHWSSPLNILDFDDINQGAGNQTPSDISGTILCILPMSGGAIIHTYTTAISMRFTNNAAAPFVFKGIPGALGAAREPACSVSSKTAQYQYALSATKVVQRLTLTSCEYLFPDFTSWVTSSPLQEKWNIASQRVELLAIPNNTAEVTVTVVADHYIVLSVGGQTLQYAYAFVYDILSDRWGKLNVPHVAVFSGTSSTVDLTFLQETGQLVTVRVQDRAAGPLPSVYYPSVMIFGHIQERHDRFITFHEVLVDVLLDRAPNPNQLPEPTATIVTSETGSNRSGHQNLVRTTRGAGDTPQNYSYLCYEGRVTAQNGDIVLYGNLRVNSLLVKVTKHGYR